MTRLITIEYDEYRDLIRLKRNVNISIFEKIISEINAIINNVQPMSDETKQLLRGISRQYENAIEFIKEEIKEDEE